jgi:tRNA A37 methylthiotransferase MiaB
MADQVDPAVKAERAARLATLERRLRADYFARLVGQRLRVLVESPLPGQPDRVAGTACRYATVHAPAAGLQAGQLVDLTAATSHGDHLEAKPVVAGGGQAALASGAC